VKNDKKTGLKVNEKKVK